MQEKEVLAIIRRLRMKLITSRSENTSDKDDLTHPITSLPKHIKSLKKNLSGELRNEILCQPRDSIPRNSNKLPPTPNNVQNTTGSLFALPIPMPNAKVVGDAVVPISNAPHITDTTAEDFPDRFEFEIYRARSRIAELEAIVKDKDQRLMRAIIAIEDEIQYWHRGLYDHVWETMGEIQTRLRRLQGSLEFLKDIQPHIYPAMKLPERWKNSKAKNV